MIQYNDREELANPSYYPLVEPMDPLSIILVAANLLALVDNFYRGVIFVRNVAQDPK